MIGPLSNNEEFSKAFGCKAGQRMSNVHKCKVSQIHTCPKSSLLVLCESNFQGGVKADLCLSLPETVGRCGNPSPWRRTSDDGGREMHCYEV